MFIGRDQNLAFNGLDRDGSRGLVSWKPCVGVEDEQRDRATAMLEQRLLAVAVRGWSFGANRVRFGGKVKDQRRSFEAGFGSRTEAFVLYG